MPTLAVARLFQETIAPLHSLAELPFFPDAMPNKPFMITMLILRIALGAFFIWSGAVKLADLSSFVDTVGNYQIVDRPWDAVFGYFVPWFEIVAGFAIVTGFGLKGGLVSLMGMLLGFSIAIAWVWSEGLNINCGCYGKSDEPTNYGLHIIYNALLFLTAAGLFWTSLRGGAKRKP
ncbi:DoxX family protein [bacterium]|nr:DoxX family protein [Akkermansiaceae bacterium]MDA7936178.1 DoxX family protein [bacterium]MDA7862694.1 DoxX family protein [Akkermansiaceae bacterium]MDB4258342.1 DoxX family protein [Akkermansiaceae bacterium]MDB4272827.1 DoxX family protein [Akkermansiaceae bacterium]